MVPAFVPLYAMIVVLFSLIYFGLASIPFLFVPLDNPDVSRLFRGLFSVYFRMVGFTALPAMAAFAASGRMALAAGMLLLSATAFVLRRWMLQRIDVQQSAWRSGDARAMRRLRWIHWSSMLGNLLVIVGVASGVPPTL
jgi:hypothetical protein